MPTGTTNPDGPSPAAQRPRLFAPGTPIGPHLRVERLVRIRGDRVVYLVNNRKPRWYTRKCWACGNKHSEPTANACSYCARPLGLRRFLMTSRWELGSALQYQAYVHRRLRYRALSHPVALYRYRDQLLSCFPWDGAVLLSGEPAPLASRTVLSVAFQIADALAFLHAYGVVLADLTPGNILMAPDGRVRLFDLDVAHLVDRSIPASDDPTQAPQRDLRTMASLLEPWVPVGDTGLRDFLKQVRRGACHTADALASRVAAFAWNRGDVVARADTTAAASDVGVVRQRNEDAWGWRALDHDHRVFVVSDGLGGHDAGHAASALTVRTVIRALRRRLAREERAPELVQVETWLREAATQANDAVRTLARQHHLQMASTLLVLVARPGHALLANVGDSRAYLLREGRLAPLTEDHSVAAAMVAAGKLEPDELRTHPKAGVLLQVLGAETSVDPDVYQLDLAPGDRVLMCTDGLWHVGDHRLAELLGEPEPRRAVRALLRAANDTGGHDNITALIVDIPAPDSPGE